ncbi:DUF4260 domain-containing protein [Chitinophaga barathri]|uniref:DUF4260 family protein n=1 Tax=Chitinophaga barathri TaxID=1647451 RepID=A0A3N4MS46_9BACT|nr:DUF4260 domain-containing protein [Chitinophaga barathri]RPD38213.1 DUF4260 family protein [Chitinophaga barathri]
MTKLLKLEEAAMFLLALLMFVQQCDLSWWWFWGCLLLPDLSMLGYLVNTRTGAYVYNFFHHKGVALLIYFAGTWFQVEPLTFAGIVLFAHSSMDRVFGYGLKLVTGFQDTHLGRIGKK